MTYAPSGNVYEGEWENGVKQGHGKMVWGDRGEAYVGWWMNGVPHGFGTYTWASHTHKSQSSPQQSQHQTTKPDQFPMENRYDGHWENGKRNGSGTFLYSTGAKYVGEWKDNMKHGNGFFRSENGRVYDGLWKNDRPVDEWPRFHNDTPFTFHTSLLSHSIQTSPNLETTTHDATNACLRTLSAVILRHTHALRAIYTHYCTNAGTDAAFSDRAISMPSMCKFFRDIRLTGVSVDTTVGMRKGGVTLVELDRAIARGYSDDNLFRERYDHPHSTTHRFIFYEFIEAVLCASELVYGGGNQINQQQQQQHLLPMHEKGLAACLAALIKNDILPNLTWLSAAATTAEPVNQEVEKKSEKAVWAELSEAVEKSYSARLYKIYEVFSRKHPLALPGSLFDRTMSVRDLLHLLADIKIVEQPDQSFTTADYIKVVSDLVPSVSDSSSDSICCNLDIELVPQEVLDVLFACGRHITDHEIQHDMNIQQLEQAARNMPHVQQQQSSSMAASNADISIVPTILPDIHYQINPPSHDVGVASVSNSSAVATVSSGAGGNGGGGGGGGLVPGVDKSSRRISVANSVTATATTAPTSAVTATVTTMMPVVEKTLNDDKTKQDTHINKSIKHAKPGHAEVSTANASTPTAAVPVATSKPAVLTASNKTVHSPPQSPSPILLVPKPAIDIDVVVNEAEDEADEAKVLTEIIFEERATTLMLQFFDKVMVSAETLASRRRY